MKDVIYGIAKTIMDGLKDAEAQYEYARTANESGKHDLALRHIEEAKKRLAGVKEWYDFGTKMLGDKPESIVGVFMELFLQWHRGVVDKLATFKPGA